MDVPTTISVHFPGKRTETLHALSIAGAAALLLARQYKRGEGPLLLELAEPATKLYFQEGILRWYLTGQMPYKEVMDALWCDGLFRNKTALVTQHENEVDAGSLWMRRADRLQLIDEDQEIEIAFNTAAHLFEEL